ncbi:protein of unknown function [Candidatus Filomicrobium marinum]|uniref:Uncharacterized protein n=1 Tax=Candidatus Filomicrobium marinum TaxID=1608628 RepID=A0A0D6JFN4_9HYPH|nr:protein of unknown function [Candidatus Filomicrobium marinum]CPR19422.1 protein of unknown function [Candidatus Filomicrobium marinum]
MIEKVADVEKEEVRAVLHGSHVMRVSEMIAGTIAVANDRCYDNHCRILASMGLRNLP